MTFPVPPAPATWSKNQAIRAPRLRADAANIAYLYTKRPLFFSTQTTSGQIIANITTTLVSVDTTYIDNWFGHASPTSANYVAQLSGWYLLQGTVSYVNAVTQTGVYAAGIHANQNSSASNLTNSQVVPFLGGSNVSHIACDLVQLISSTGDSAAVFALQSQGVSVGIAAPTFFKAEWVALPTSTYAGLTAVTGTVVTSLPTPVLWPPGSGTTITSGLIPGATFVNVASNTGIIVGGSIGLGYYNGQAVISTAETVSVTSVVGGAIGVSPTLYGHAINEPVAVPVSAAFLNNQVRDIVNFLAYPPIARLTNVATSQSLAAQTFPAATAVNFTQATVDNFSGWTGGAGTSSYTAQVGGVYFIYGQVALASVITSLHAGISVAGGTVQWGDSIRTGGSSAQNLCATVSKVLRVTAGQTIQLMACTTTAAALATGLAAFYSTLVIVWRGI